jgi:hypothetical protein
MYQRLDIMYQRLDIMYQRLDIRLGEGRRCRQSDESILRPGPA